MTFNEDMAEFKGKVLADLEHIKGTVDNIHTDLKPRVEKVEKRVQHIYTVSGVVGALTAWIWTTLLSWFHKGG